MIKIIEKGTRQKKQCENCGCIFSFDREDVETTSHYGSLSSGEETFIHCPQCSVKIELESTR